MNIISKSIKEFLLYLLIICLLTALIVTVIYKFDKKDQEASLKKYNNGICPQCQTEWHFKQKTESFCNRSYIYECENGHIIEFGKLPEN